MQAQVAILDEATTWLNKAMEALDLHVEFGTLGSGLVTLGSLVLVVWFLMHLFLD